MSASNSGCVSSGMTIKRDDRRRQEEPARLLLVLDEIGDLSAQEVAQAESPARSTPITLVQP